MRFYEKFHSFLMQSNFIRSTMLVKLIGEKQKLPKAKCSDFGNKQIYIGLPDLHW